MTGIDAAMPRDAGPDIAVTQGRKIGNPAERADMTIEVSFRRGFLCAARNAAAPGLFDTTGLSGVSALRRDGRARR